MQEPINNQSMLKVGTILRGTYRIDSYLSSGGFGNTYVATNIEFEERVAIKEFFMKGVTHRDDNQTTISVSNAENRNSFLEQKEKFKKEARRIRQLRNEHIVKVHDLFEENGTAYYVMDYVDGENLAERLQKTGKPMTESEVRLILPQILDALKAVHDAGIWHLDLKPANIMLEKGGVIKLIDFGASKQLNSQKGGATTSTAITYTNGYAPREQMEQNYDKFGPWTDIYALGATLYNLLTNKRPPLPTDIDDDLSSDKHEALPFPDGVSTETKSMVLMMLNTNRNNRPQSIAGVESFFLKLESENAGQLSNKDNAYNSDADSESVNDDEETVIAEPQLKKVVNTNHIRECNGHEFVDLGLSACWATMNIGASSRDDAGIGYIWGDSNGWIEKEKNRSIFNRFFNYRPQVDVICGNDMYDTATKMWGSAWKMPTLSEFEELINKCKMNIIDDSHIKVVSPNGKSIVLHEGVYWSGVMMNTFEFRIKDDKVFYRFHDYSIGSHLNRLYLIRPVIDKKKIYYAPPTT